MFSEVSIKELINQIKDSTGEKAAQFLNRFIEII